MISRNGRTAAVMSSSLPAAPILTASADPATCRMAGFLCGVLPMVVNPKVLDGPPKLARRMARELRFGAEGEKLLVVRGFGAEPLPDTPSVTVVTIWSEGTIGSGPSVARRKEVGTRLLGATTSQIPMI